MANVEGAIEVKMALRKMMQKSKQDHDCSVIVGYTQNYSIYVHENMEAFHPVGQAKYLEQPARELRKEMGKIIKTAYARGATLRQALLIAGLRLQRASQELVPVDTGALKASAFTKVDK